MLELAGFLGFHFHGHFAAAVLKLDFAAHAPAFAEVVSQVDDHVGQVDATMAFGVFVPIGMGISEHVVAVEVTGVNCLSVAAYCEAR